MCQLKCGKCGKYMTPTEKAKDLFTNIVYGGSLTGLYGPSYIYFVQSRENALLTSMKPDDIMNIDVMQFTGAEKEAVERAVALISHAFWNRRWS